MKITKLNHATLVVESNGKHLIIDPGNRTQLPPGVKADVVVITHEHPDHWTPENLTELKTRNTELTIFALPSVAKLAPEVEIVEIAPGESVAASGFELKFFGGLHEIIHRSIPQITNVGVLVNNSLYYPGDSYAVPKNFDVEVLAAPIGAPWLRISDAMDFVLAVKAKHAFGTHDDPLSQFGLGMGRERLRWATEQNGGTFYEIDPGDSIEI